MTDDTLPWVKETHGQAMAPTIRFSGCVNGRKRRRNINIQAVADVAILPGVFDQIAVTGTISSLSDHVLKLLKPSLFYGS